MGAMMRPKKVERRGLHQPARSCSPMLPYLFLLPLVGLFIGFASLRFSGRLTIGMIVTLGLSFSNLMGTAGRTGKIDFTTKVLPPLLTMGAFVFGLGLGRVVMIFSR